MKNIYKTFLAIVLSFTSISIVHAQSVQRAGRPSHKIFSNNASQHSSPVYVAPSPSAVIYTDDFNGANDTNALKARGYIPYYRGTGPQGTTATWFQGIPISAGGVIDAFNGPDSGYVAADYQVVTGINDIDSWLVLPALNVGTGDTISFYSQSFPGSGFADSVRVMYSDAGDSVPEALTWVELGRFKVNTAGIWERKTFNALSPGAAARFAIRYAVPDGGPNGNNSDYTGIDQLDIIQAPVAVTPCTATLTFNPALSIPDNDSLGVDDTEVVSSAPGTILGTDVKLTQVCFDITHTWVGDLIVTLTAPDGTSIVLMDRPGVPATGAGCDQDNVNTCVVPGTGNEMENVCDIPPALFAISGTYTAANGTDLDAINTAGGPPNGNWILSVSDNAGADLGVLNTWSLDFDIGFAVSAAWLPDPDTLCADTSAAINLDSLVTGNAGGAWSGSGVAGNIFDPAGLSGNINVTYTVNDTVAGCSKTETHVFTVSLSVPTCGFTYIIANTTADFTNTSPDAFSYSWDFGDGFFDATANPSHTYTANGSYIVTLTTANICGSTTCNQTIVIAGCPDAIADGSFDIDSTSVTSPWAQLSTNFGTPLCDATSCGTGGGTAGPNTGAWWAWFGGGGTVFPEIGSLSQPVTLPSASTANLYFQLWLGTCGDPTDFLNVYVEADTLYSTFADSVNNPLCNAAGYTLITVNMDTYCDGIAHIIEFYSETHGAANTNISVDDVSILACPVGIEEFAIADEISITPNPASFAVNLSLKGMKKDLKVTIYNSIGQSLYSRKIEKSNSTSYSEKIDVSNWGKGIYIFRVDGSDKSVSRKIVIY